MDRCCGVETMGNLCVGRASSSKTWLCRLVLVLDDVVVLVVVVEVEGVLTVKEGLEVSGAGMKGRRDESEVVEGEAKDICDNDGEDKAIRGKRGRLGVFVTVLLLFVLLVKLVWLLWLRSWMRS